MFLPQPALPNLSLRKRTIDPSGTGAHRKRRSARPNTESFSAVDSDEDEHVSEADRDARLAFVDSYYCCII